MKRKRKTRPNPAAFNRLAKRLRDEAKQIGSPDRSTVLPTWEEQVLAARQEIIAAWGIRPRYQKHFPRLESIWEQRLRPFVRSHLPKNPYEVFSHSFLFAGSAASLMQELEDQYGAFPVRVRWAVYDAFAKAAGLVGAGEDADAKFSSIQKSRRLNDTKRQKRSLDTRDARIVAEWQALAKDMPGKGQRDIELATKHDLDPRQIFNITKAAGVR